MIHQDAAARDSGFTTPGRPVEDSADFSRQADSGTLAPLIFNAWYVIALKKDVDRTLRSIEVLGEPLVYYRTTEGQPVVLDDRCAHRRFPLSKSTLKGDTIQCGYHGFTYAASGRCVWSPGISKKEGEAKLHFGVRSYPCAERGPWLWVWMGDPEHANPADIPLPEVQLPEDSTVAGYKMNPANYMLLIENVHDLSHLHFLHGAVDASYLDVLPRELPSPPHGIAWEKIVESTETGLLGTLCADDPQRRVRLEDEIYQYGPSLAFGYQRRKRPEGEVEEGGPPPRPAVLTIAHAITPLDHRNTHQFFFVSSSDAFTQGMERVLHDVQEVVFEQDVTAVAYMQAHIDGDRRPGQVEFNMAYDRNGLKMRRILREMKSKEQPSDSSTGHSLSRN